MKLTINLNERFSRTSAGNDAVMEPNNGDFWLLGAEASSADMSPSTRRTWSKKRAAVNADLNEVSEIPCSHALNHAGSRRTLVFDGNDPHEVKPSGTCGTWKQDSFKESDHLQ